MRPIHPRPTVQGAKMFSKSAPKTVNRPFHYKSVVQNQVWKPKVTTTKPAVPTASRVIGTGVNKNTAKGNMGNGVNASACWVWRPIKPNGAKIVLKRMNYV